MQIHPLARQFATVADSYERGRPEYAPAVLGAFAAELGIGPGEPVLDLGAGTGKLSRALVAFGFDVVAVEPQAPLRRRLAGYVGADRALEGVAEAIPLADASVAAVTVADAFHWFDRARALLEIHRVLRPGGSLAVFTTAPHWEGASWADELEQLVTSARTEHPHFDGRPWQDDVRESGCFSEPRIFQVKTFPEADPEGILAHLASVSWIAALPAGQRDEMFARMRVLLESGTTPDRLPLVVEVGLATIKAA